MLSKSPEINDREKEARLLPHLSRAGSCKQVKHPIMTSEYCVQTQHWKLMSSLRKSLSWSLAKEMKAKKENETMNVLKSDPNAIDVVSSDSTFKNVLLTVPECP